jgi:hypothetical protein
MEGLAHGRRYGTARVSGIPACGAPCSRKTYPVLMHFLTVPCVPASLRKNKILRRSRAEAQRRGVLGDRHMMIACLQAFLYPFFARPKNGYPQERAPLRFASRPESGLPRRAHSQGVVMNSSRLKSGLRQHNDRILDHAPVSAAKRWGFKTLKTQTSMQPGYIRCVNVSGSRAVV